MKKFNFRLENLLKIRKIEENHKMSELAQVVSKVESEKNQVRKYFDDSRKYQSIESQKMREGKFDIRFTRTLQSYFYVLEKKRKVAERNITELQQELDKRRVIANNARKNRRVIEIMKEKKYKEFLFNLNKEEQKELDEFNQKKTREMVS